MARNKAPPTRVQVSAPKSGTAPPYEWLIPGRSFRAPLLPESFSELYRATSWSILDGRGASQEAKIQSFKNEWRETLNVLDVHEERREDALHELIEAHILYRCLRSSVDRAPQLDVVRNDIRAIHDRLETALTKLNKIEESTSGLSGRDEALLRQIELGQHSTGGGRQRKIDDAVLSRLFEIKTRQFLGQVRFSMERMIRPFLGITVPRKRGQPRKYSKDFLILRCARIFEKFDSQKRPLKVKRYNISRNKSPSDFDHGPFYNFTHMVILVVDKTALFGSTHYGLEKSIQDMLRVRTDNPHIDQLVHKRSSPTDLLNFVELSESKKEPAQK